MSNSGSLKVTTPTDREILITRVVAAPRRLVFEALTRPDLLQRWLIGPPGWTMVTCEDSPEVGGTFRYAWKGPAGEALAMHGVYREVVPPERIVRVEAFDVGCPSQGGEQLATLTLAEHDGKTMLSITVLYPSKEARDAMLASGMEHGMAVGYERLEALLSQGDSATRPG